MNEQLSEILRLLRNLIRIGTVSAVKLDDGLCRVDTGSNTTGWLHWLNARAGKTRSWNAPSVGEQVLVLCLGGELDTGFVLPGIFSDDNPAPSASADALHWSFPDGAVIEYEPATGALTASGIQTATISAAVQVLLDSPLVECTQLLRTAQLDVTDGGTMKGNVTHSGGNLSSNGKVLHTHKHPGDSGGQTGAPI
ncbi:phage baseplate assembly protein V [Pantoea trifolii]|uniref:Phage baseplate assembly protein V n=1 Tax=Pantoea trifolii TaxID=2968030 RepID=A0ABT1VQB9_9GAMM|nr:MULTISPECIES: phage baseplate assembly protein V [unclassified Pantoea]MCQ8229098.1 phage baseplate assembly protein V [Pantoea sp. MMK2]MCQ8237272.1 phage baseplate assembly protein V [Pantoea sp. MMK3]